MKYPDWMLRGPEIVTCNCAWGCPCQFNAAPTSGDCTAIGAMQITEGWYEDIRLDGLRWVSLGAWPGPIHLGGGTTQRIIDQRADAGQRQALEAILSGKASKPGKTPFDVFAAMTDLTLPTLFLPIEFSASSESGKGAFRVQGIAETTVEPIRNPVTGKAQRASIHLRDGFEFSEAECASGTTRTYGAIDLNVSASHAHLAMLHLNGAGILRPC